MFVNLLLIQVIEIILNDRPTNNNDDQSMELTVKSKQLIQTAKTADFCSRPRPRPRPGGFETKTKTKTRLNWPRVVSRPRPRSRGLQH